MSLSMIEKPASHMSGVEHCDDSAIRNSCRLSNKFIGSMPVQNQMGALEDGEVEADEDEGEADGEEGDGGHPVRGKGQNGKALGRLNVVHIQQALRGAAVRVALRVDEERRALLCQGAWRQLLLVRLEQLLKHLRARIMAQQQKALLDGFICYSCA